LRAAFSSVDMPPPPPSFIVMAIGTTTTSNLGSGTRAGLAISSHNSSTSATAVFADLTIR
jgi:hypothetical protein